MGQSWSEGRRGGGGGGGEGREEVDEQGRGGSAGWPTPLDITLPLEFSSKAVKRPETVSEVGEADPEDGELFQSIRGSYEVKDQNTWVIINSITVIFGMCVTYW